MSNITQFSPVNLTTLIRTPLEHFFSLYGKDIYAYDPDPLKTKIIIDNFNNYNQETDQKKPRILVKRGDYEIQKTGLTDNMFSGKTAFETKGLKDVTNAVFIQGRSEIIVEARQEGVCEIITDMVSHFLVWSRPLLCNSFGFKEFAMPMDVSDASPGKEDTEIFTVTIEVPWIKEEMWRVHEDALQLNNLKLSLTDSTG